MNVNEIKEKRAGYVSAEQKNKLFALMQERPALCSGRFSTSFSKKDGQKEWANIAITLNGCPGGKKSWMQWRKTWQDMRSKVKAKQASIKRHANGTGGGPPLNIKLKQNEEEILSLISNVAVNGHSSVEESIVHFDFNNDAEADAQSSSKLVPPIADIPQPQPQLVNNFENMDPEYCDEEVIVLKEMPKPDPIKDIPSNKGGDHGCLVTPTSVKKHTASSAKKLQVAASAAELLSKTAEDKLELKKNYYKRKLEIMENAENEKKSYHNKMVKLKEKELLIEERKACALEKLCNNLNK